MKHSEEAVDAVLADRAKGEKWSVLWLVHGAVCSAAFYRLRKAKYPPKTPGAECQSCRERINVRSHFCKHCGTITETGKKAP